MKLSLIAFVTLIYMLTSSCSTEEKHIVFDVVEIEAPTAQSGQSRITTDIDGQAYLSWIEYDDTDTFRLQYAVLQEDEKWSTPKTISQGDKWFINWADFPSLAVFENGDLAAHWLQMRDIGTYDYDVRISTISKENIKANLWQPSFIPHNDGLAAEHGFVSLLPLNDNKMMASWLDGRNTVGPDHGPTKNADHHGHEGKGAMTLRTATFDITGQLTNEVELDDRICDCCQTDMAMTSEGPVVVYRDRSDDEIRDMSIVRYLDGNWTKPLSIHNDRWEINGCPVNGPAVAAQNNLVAIAWYTAAKGLPKVLVAISKDAGANFDLPIEVDVDDPLGRVDIDVIEQDKFMVTWLGKATEESNSPIKYRIIDSYGQMSDDHNLVFTSSKRRSGFPILAKDHKGMLLTWTTVEGTQQKIKTARLVRK